jgi:polysaccharide export outer membrane protein
MPEEDVMSVATRNAGPGPLRTAAAVMAALFISFGARAEAQPRSLDGMNLSLRMSEALNAGDAKPAQPAEIAAPARRSTARDYRIGSEDLIEIQVFGVDQLTRTVRVNSLGLVSLPLVGNLQVGGLTAQEAEALIAARLADTYLQNPQVSLFIKEYTSQRVTIEGAVNKPGIYPLRGQTTLLRSLALAGGQASLSDMSEVMLFRADASGKRDAQVFDVERIRRGEIEDPAVINDDLIVVNRSKARTLMKDSLLRDMLDAVNPFSPFVPR